MRGSVALGSCVDILQKCSLKMVSIFLGESGMLGAGSGHFSRGSQSVSRLKLVAMYERKKATTDKEVHAERREIE